MATPLVYQKYPNYHFLALKQWFGNILVLNLIYTLKNNGGLQRAFVCVNHTFPYLLYWKLKLRKILNFNSLIPLK